MPPAGTISRRKKTWSGSTLSTCATHGRAWRWRCSPSPTKQCNGPAGISDRGVIVRVYRDRSRYEAEELKALRFHQPSSTRLLRGARNVHVRAKQGSE